MKIGVIFSGTLRCFDMKSFQRSFPPGKHEYIIVASVNPQEDSTNSTEILEKTIEIRDDGIIVITKQFEIPESWKFVDRRTRFNNMNTVSMFFHNKSAYEELISRAPDVDLIVKYRSDISSSLELVESFETFETFKSLEVFHPVINTYFGMNDQVGFGSPTSMAIYCGLYDHIQEYVDNNAVEFHPETLLGHHLRTNNVKISTVNFRYTLNAGRHSALGCDRK